MNYILYEHPQPEKSEQFTKTLFLCASCCGKSSPFTHRKTEMEIRSLFGGEAFIFNKHNKSFSMGIKYLTKY